MLLLPNLKRFWDKCSFFAPQNYRLFHNARPKDKLRIWLLTMKKSMHFQDKKKVKKGSLLTNWLVFTRETKALIRENKKEKITCSVVQEK